MTDTPTIPVPQVYAAIAAVQADMSIQGIAKDRNNQSQGYKFRGIDDIYNAIAPMLAKHKLCILPRCVERIATERATKQGGIMLCVTVHAEFDLVSAADGSKHTISTYGEAMDSGDKATNKAMSAAYKYAAFQAFAIPTEGDNDADAHTHELAADTRPQRQEPAPAPRQQRPEPARQAALEAGAVRAPANTTPSAKDEAEAKEAANALAKHLQDYGKPIATMIWYASKSPTWAQMLAKMLAAKHACTNIIKSMGQRGNDVIDHTIVDLPEKPTAAEYAAAYDRLLAAGMLKTASTL